MECYLDNSATTKAFPEVAELVAQVMCNTYGNPSSMHSLGVEAEKIVKDSKEIFAKILKCDSKNIYFTSGGTESDNMALIGAARSLRRRGTHLITTKIEHPAILQTMKHLEEEGFTVTYLPVDASGRVRPEDLRAAMTPETILVSVMHTNNEIGALEPIAELGKIISECNPLTLFHVDAVQGFGKAKIFPKKMNIDLLSISGHKIHGPKGMGVLYVGDRVRLLPISFGGGQQNGLRNGTENVPGIAGIGLAAKMLYEHLEEDTEKLLVLKTQLISGLLALDVRVNGIPNEKGYLDAEDWKEVKGEIETISEQPICEAKTTVGETKATTGTEAEPKGKPVSESADTPRSAFSDAQLLLLADKWNLKECAPHVISGSFTGIRSEVLLHTLENEGIYVSAGSACSSHKPQPSATLMAVGLPKEYLDTTLRFSLSVHTTAEEIAYTLQVLEKNLPILQRYTRH